MITSGYKGFGRGEIVFPPISPRVSALKKITVSRKFELELGHKGLIYHWFVQPSVFFFGLPQKQTVAVVISYLWGTKFEI